MAETQIMNLLVLTFKPNTITILICMFLVFWQEISKQLEKSQYAILSYIKHFLVANLEFKTQINLSK